MSKLPYRQVHLDFHTPALPFTLGEKFDKNSFQETLKKAKINSITLTGRCHHGHIYYDTKMAARHPQMKNDFLMKQVDACHEIDISAPIYLTVGWDSFAADHHPEWLERKADGSIYGFEDHGQLSPGWKTMCFNTPYLNYLKEQIKDTIQHFENKLDGLFFDIVWQDPCCCNYCIDKMIKKGFDPENIEEQRQFAKLTEKYLKNEIYKTVQAEKADCPIFFNEGNILPNIRPSLHEYEHLEIESLPSGEWGYQHFPTVVRYVKNLGKDYAGMTGKFHRVWADFGSYKNQAALEYETFLALAHGAKCSIGDQMYPDGTLQSATYDLIGSVYQQVEELENYNDDTQAVTEIAIIHPQVVVDYHEKVDTSLAGAVNMLNEGHYQFDIVDLDMDWDKYKVIILPDKIKFTDDIQEKIRTYLENENTHVIASYESGLQESGDFSPIFDLKYIGDNPYEPTYGRFNQLFEGSLPHGEIVLHGPSLLVKSFSEYVIGKEYRPLYQRNYLHYYSHFQAPVDQATGFPVATLKEKIAYFSHPLFRMYKEQGVLQYKRIFLTVLDQLLGTSVIQTNLPCSADLILNYSSERKELVVNILHYVPQRKALELDTIEDVIPLYDTKIDIQLNSLAELVGKEISEIVTIDDIRSGNKIEYALTDERLTFQVPKVEGYEIVVIKFN